MWNQDEFWYHKESHKPKNLSFLCTSDQTNVSTSRPSMSFLNDTFENVTFELTNGSKMEDVKELKKEIVESSNGKEESEVEITLEVNDLYKLAETEIKTEEVPEKIKLETNTDNLVKPQVAAQTFDTTEAEVVDNIESPDDSSAEEAVKKKRKKTTYKRKWPEDPADCDICGTHYTTKRSYQRHYKVVHELKQHKCQQCGKQWSWPDSLAKHIKEVHQGIVKTYSCDQCDKVVKGITTLRRHKAKDHPPPCCDFCKITFNNADEFNEHIRKEHIEKYCL